MLACGFPLALSPKSPIPLRGRTAFRSFLLQESKSCHLSLWVSERSDLAAAKRRRYDVKTAANQQLKSGISPKNLDHGNSLKHDTISEFAGEDWKLPLLPSPGPDSDLQLRECSFRALLQIPDPQLPSTAVVASRAAACRP